MHIGELAAAKPAPTLLYASTLIRFRTKIHAISMYDFICAATCEIMHAIIMYFSPPWGGTFNVLGNIRYDLLSMC